jgi:hypothetical protein
MEPEDKVRIKAQIEEGERLAKIARAEIEKAKRAEIDVSAQERELAETERKLRLMRTVYLEGK